jgi:hypothetical protein
VLNRDMTGGYSTTGSTTGLGGLGSGTAGTSGTTGGFTSAGGTFPSGTGTAGTTMTVPTASDMIGGATEGTHVVPDPDRDKNRKI